jgi:predicted GNAT family acetyltransferase
MKIRGYETATDYLERAQEWLEENEAANSLMLGIAFRLVRRPALYSDPRFISAEISGRLVLGAIMTPPYKLVLAGRLDEAESVVPSLIHRLREEKWPVPGVMGPGALARSFAQGWAALVGGSYQLAMRQRVHHLHRLELPPPEGGFLRPAARTEFEMVSHWIKAFQEEALGENDPGSNPDAIKELVNRRLADESIYLWVDSEPVSMAMKTRPTRHGISVSAVYTPPEHRRRGYATACVAELSRTLLASGYRFCSLFTDLANPTSNHIYRKIGYRPVDDFDQFVFQGDGG